MASVRRMLRGPPQKTSCRALLVLVTGDLPPRHAEVNMPDSTAPRYAALVVAGEIDRDPAQEAAVSRLSRLNERLAMHRLARKSSSLGWLFGKRENAEPDLKGLYIWGEVGRGKTMLMDLFFGTCPVKRKWRTHFHAFMLEV